MPRSNTEYLKTAVKNNNIEEAKILILNGAEFNEEIRNLCDRSNLAWESLIEAYDCCEALAQSIIELKYREKDSDEGLFVDALVQEERTPEAQSLETSNHRGILLRVYPLIFFYHERKLMLEFHRLVMRLVFHRTNDIAELVVLAHNELQFKLGQRSLGKVHQAKLCTLSVANPHRRLYSLRRATIDDSGNDGDIDTDIDTDTDSLAVNNEDGLSTSGCSTGSFGSLDPNDPQHPSSLHLSDPIPRGPK